ncbi:MAG: hypothetical protein ACI4BH_04660 [Muribaculaceae bacterium]
MSQTAYSEPELAILKDATTSLNMKTRTYHRIILKVARANGVYQRALRGW